MVQNCHGNLRNIRPTGISEVFISVSVDLLVVNKRQIRVPIIKIKYNPQNQTYQPKI